MSIALIVLLILLILTPYLLYPLLLIAISFLMPKGLRVNSGIKPDVTIIIPTFNEEKVIIERLKNLESLSYPKDKLQVIVVDSGSADRTYDVAQELVKTLDTNFLVLKQSERNGKANAINFATQHATGEIILVSDANALFEKDVIDKAVVPFEDERVGGVGGKFTTIGTNAVGKGEELYWSIEDRIREAESRLYSMTNFSGEFNAFRKSLDLILDEKSLCEDLDLTIQIVRKNYRVSYVPDAVVYEPAVENTEDLIKQKRRRAVGALQVIFKHLDMLANPKLILFNLLFFCHRTLRQLTPILALTLFAVLCYVFFTIDYPTKYTVIGLIALSFLAALVFIEFVLRKRVFHTLYYFLVVQLSYTQAWIDFISGKYIVTWEKTDSSRDLNNVRDKIKKN